MNKSSIPDARPRREPALPDEAGDAALRAILDVRVETLTEAPWPVSLGALVVSATPMPVRVAAGRHRLASGTRAGGMIAVPPGLAVAVLGEPAAARGLVLSGVAVTDTPVERLWCPEAAVVVGLLLRQVERGGCYDAGIAAGLAATLIAAARREIGAETHDRTGSCLGEALARRLTTHVDDHLEETLTVEALAAVAGLSRDAFVRRFKASFGVPPYRFVMERRIARAVALLTESDAPLAEIAYAAGFSSQAHMNAALSRALHRTPGAIRRAALPPSREDDRE